MYYSQKEYEKDRELLDKATPEQKREAIRKTFEMVQRIKAQIEAYRANQPEKKGVSDG